jgi:hypothetical protein
MLCDIRFSPSLAKKADRSDSQHQIRHGIQRSNRRIQHLLSRIPQTDRLGQRLSIMVQERKKGWESDCIVCGERSTL